MLLNYLDKLRAKPPRERAHAAFLWAVGITSVVFFAWLIMLPFRFSDSSFSLPESVSPEELKETASTFGALWQDIRTSAASFDELFEETFTAENPAVLPPLENATTTPAH